MRFKPLILALGLSTLPNAYATEQTEILKYSYTYDDHRRIKTIDGPREDVKDITTYDYEQGSLKSVTNALGHVTESQDFDDILGLPLTVIDPNGVVTKLTYDDYGKLTSSTLKSSAGDLKTTYIYDDATDLIKKTIRPDGSEINYEYDTFLRLKATYNGLGERIEYELDDMGNITKETIKSETGEITKVQKSVFDELDRLIKSISYNNTTVTISYDANSNQLSLTDPMKRTNNQSFDALNRLMESTDALNNITKLEYNEFDQIRFVKHPQGVTTEYQYDDFGRLVKRISPDSGVTTYQYDEANNIIERKDAEGLVTHYAYDALNRIKEKKFNADENFDYTITYVYDEVTNGNFGIGRLTGVKDAHGLYAYHYDDRGNLVTQIRSTNYDGGALEHVTRYHYNAKNQQAGITYPSGVRISYDWDKHGRVSQITALLPGETKAKPIASDLAYLPYGGITNLTWGNGLTLKRTFDKDYRIDTQAISKIDERTYSYDDNSNITGIERGDNSQTFTYDDLNRLEGESGSYGNKTYSYDALGNRLTSSMYEGAIPRVNTFVYKANSNQIAEHQTRYKQWENAYKLTHNKSGNLHQLQNDIYHYNPIGQLQGVYSFGNWTLYNYFDAYGRRVKRADDLPERTYYTYGLTGEVLNELDYRKDSLKKSSEYVWFGNMPLAHIAGKDGKYTISYIHSDHLNTPRYATNHNKTVVWKWESDAFGVGLADEDVDGDEQLTTISLRFPGQIYDPSTGLHYNYHRFYNPDGGRYRQTDPIGLAGGPNTYAYANNDPIGTIDPSGLSGVRPPTRRGSWAPPPGQAIVNVRVRNLERRVRDIDPAFRYNTYRPVSGPHNRYNTNDIFALQNHLNNARSAPFCGNGAAFWRYKRPSGYRKNVRNTVFNSAKGQDSLVRSPEGTIIPRRSKWDMGHRPGYEFWKHQYSASGRGLSRKEFLNEHNTSNHYRPETIRYNRSHQGETPHGPWQGE